MFVFRVPSIVVCLASLLGLPSDGRAQAPRPERPYRGLFGGGLGATEQSLIFNGSVGGGYDDNILLDQPGIGGLDPRVRKSGTLGMANGSLAYSIDKDRASIGISAGSSSRYYPDQQTEFIGSHNAGAGATIRFGERTSFTAQQSVGYQPYTFAEVLPVLGPPEIGQLPDATIDLATGTDSFLSLRSSAGFSHRFSRRTTFTTGYNYMQSESAFTDSRFSRHGGSAGMLFTLSGSLDLRLGYGYQTGRYADSQASVESQNFDIGVDYRKALSFSRRTTLGFSTGTTAVSNGDETAYRATGSANLSHEIGRTWAANATFNRSVQFLDALLVPVFQDSFGASVGGLVNRRVQFQSGIRASIGTIGFGGTTSNNQYDTYLASAGLGIAISRHMNMSVDYGFYRYRFDSNIALPIGIARNIDRQTIRASVGMWAPLFQKARR